MEFGRLNKTSPTSAAGRAPSELFPSTAEIEARPAWWRSVEQRILAVLLVHDAFAVLVAYVSAFFLRIWVPLPMTTPGPITA